MKDEGTQLLNYHTVTTAFLVFLRGSDPLHCRETANNSAFLGTLPIVAHPCGHQLHLLVLIRATELWGQSEEDEALLTLWLTDV